MRIYDCGSNLRAFAMEQCEEKMLIAAFERVKGNVPPNQEWARNFQKRFYEIGDGVSEYNIEAINRVLKRLGLPVLGFLETDATDYPRLMDKSYKARMRRAWREQYEQLNEAGRRDFYLDNRDATAVLPPPHRTYEEYKAAKIKSPKVPLSQREQNLRAAALQLQSAPAPVSEPNPVEIAAKQLALARGVPDADDLIAAIATKLDPMIALDLAGRIEEPQIRSVLLRRSLEVA